MPEVNFTAERRVGRSWGLKPSNLTAEIKQDTIDVSIGLEDKASRWAPVVLENLIKYIPNDAIPDLSATEITQAVKEVSGGEWTSWRKVGMDVASDECIDIFRMVKLWLQKEGVGFRAGTEFEGFIDGHGFGLYEKFCEHAMPLMEKVFDEKVWQAKLRPETILCRGQEWLVRLFNYRAPPHEECPTGHGGKFASIFTFVQNAYEDLNASQSRKLLIFLCVASHGRSYGPVHWLSSNMCSFAIAEIEGFKEFMQSGEYS